MLKWITRFSLLTLMFSQLLLINAFAQNGEVVAVKEQNLQEVTAGPVFSPKLANEGAAADKGEILKVEETASSVPTARTVVSDGKTYQVVQALGQYKTTAFTPEEEGNHITATGVKPKLNHTVATDWTYIPAGTKILVGDSDIVYTVEDTGVKGKVVDLFLATNKEAYTYGVQYKDIFIVQEVQ